MVQIERVTERTAKGCKCDMLISTVAELPAMNSSVDGIKILAGSKAYIIQADMWATLDDDGKWYSGGQEIS
jgi:hypothetical protein